MIEGYIRGLHPPTLRTSERGTASGSISASIGGLGSIAASGAISITSSGSGGCNGSSTDGFCDVVANEVQRVNHTLTSRYR